MTLLFCLCALLGSPETYGKAINQETQMVPIDALMANPEAYLGKVVRVKGKVREVCPMAGCWMDIHTKDQKVRLKVRDGEMVFKPSLVGKQVVAEGTVYKFDMNHEQALAYYQHLAEEKGQDFDPSTVTGGATIYQIGGIGVAVQ